MLTFKYRLQKIAHDSQNGTVSFTFKTPRPFTFHVKYDSDKLLISFDLFVWSTKITKHFKIKRNGPVLAVQYFVFEHVQIALLLF